MFMSKVLQNSPTSVFYFKIFSGVMPPGPC